MFDIYLYKNKSEKNKLNKSLTNPVTLTGVLREETSIITPIITISANNPYNYNYAYIPVFGRYYFINDILSVNQGAWRLHMQVDPLMSFKAQILNSYVILDDSTDNGSNYLPGDVWVNNVKERTDIVNFPSGLSNEGSFILITAGGETSVS